MSILSTLQPPATKEQQLFRVRNSISTLSKRIFDELVNVQREGIRIVWKNPNLSPQEIVDSLGPDALKVFQFHGALTDLILSIATSEGVEVKLEAPTNQFTVDNQGNITITDEPYNK